MELNLTFFALAIPAVLVAGISKGGFGSSVGFAAVPMLTLILEPVQAVALMLPLLVVIDFAALKPYWGKWDPKVARILILGTTPGAILGAALIKVANPDLLRFLIGALAVGFVIYQIGRARDWIRISDKPMPDSAGFLFSVGAGFTSFIAHAGGPVAAVYMLSKPLTKLEFQASTVVAFWVNNLLKLTLYLMLGLLTAQVWLADLYLVPFAVIGTYIGVYLHRIVPEGLFFTLIYVFLTVAGAKLIFDALF